MDALLLTDPVNIGYVSGFTGSTAYALLTADEALLVTDSRYTLQAARECPGFQIAETPQGSGGYPAALQSALEPRPALRRVGFEAGHVTVSLRESWTTLVPAVHWVGTENVVETLRLIKDAGEIALIRDAIAVAEAAFLSVKHLLVPGTREQDLALELEFAMRRGGAEGTAFETIVASGTLGAHPHHRAGVRPFALGDFVTIDWGATVNGYNSDITRTPVLAGSATGSARFTASFWKRRRGRLPPFRPARPAKRSTRSPATSSRPEGWAMPSATPWAIPWAAPSTTAPASPSARISWSWSRAWC